MTTCHYCSGQAHPDDIDNMKTDACWNCGADATSIRRPMFYTVAVYRISRCYGGPEEGGWYYDAEELSHAGDHTIHARMCPNEDKARDYAKTVQEILDREEPDNARSLGSVLSNGQYRALVCPEFPHERYPLVKPHYE